MKLSEILIIGECNPQGNPALDPSIPGSSGERLRRILGLDDSTYASIPKTNLSDPAWHTSQAVARAMTLVADDSPYKLLVLLGLKVRLAFKRLIGPIEQWDAKLVNGRYFVALPHPSGRCQIWNNEKSFERAREILRKLAPLVFRES